MKKTWHDFTPLFVLMGSLPFIVGILPTFYLHGQYWGGGVIRSQGFEWWVALLPAAGRNPLVAVFNGDAISPWIEYLLYLPFALNVGLALLWLGFMVSKIQIAVSHQRHSHHFQSTRQAVKK